MADYLSKEELRGFVANIVRLQFEACGSGKPTFVCVFEDTDGLISFVAANSVAKGQHFTRKRLGKPVTLNQSWGGEAPEFGRRLKQVLRVYFAKWCRRDGRFQLPESERDKLSAKLAYPMHSPDPFTPPSEEYVTQAVETFFTKGRRAFLAVESESYLAAGIRENQSQIAPTVKDGTAHGVGDRADGPMAAIQQQGHHTMEPSIHRSLEERPLLRVTTVLGQGAAIQDGFHLIKPPIFDKFAHALEIRIVLHARIIGSLRCSSTIRGLPLP